MISRVRSTGHSMQVLINGNKPGFLSLLSTSAVSYSESVYQKLHVLWPANGFWRTISKKMLHLTVLAMPPHETVSYPWKRYMNDAQLYIMSMQLPYIAWVLHATPKTLRYVFCYRIYLKVCRNRSRQIPEAHNVGELYNYAYTCSIDDVGVV